MNIINPSAPRTNTNFQKKSFRDLLEENASELEAKAAEVGIDWSKAKQYVRFDGLWKNNLKAYINKKDSGKLSLFSSAKPSKEGTIYRVVFSTKRHGGISTSVVMSSLGGISPYFSDSRRVQLRTEMVAKDRQKNGSYTLLAFLNQWEQTTLYVPERRFFYFLRKNIASHTPELKMMSDRFGSFAAIPLQDIHGNIKNFQKLYSDGRKFTLANCTTSGLFYLLGDLHSPDNEYIYITEGFATAVSVRMLASKPCAVVMALNAGNISNVVADIIRENPSIKKKIIIVADNDFETENGNTGVIAAIKTAHNTRVKVIFPRFPEGTKGLSDFNDLMIQNTDEAKNQLCYKTNKYVVQREALPYQRQLLDFGPKISADNASRTLKNYINCAISKNITAKKAVALLDGCLKISVSAPFIEELFEKKKTQRAQARLQAHNVIDGYHEKISDNVLTQHPDGYFVIHPELYDRIKSFDGFVVIKAPMGSGKTERILQRFMQDNQSAPCLVHRAAIAGEISERIGLMDYRNMGVEEGAYAKKFVVCVNSMTLPKFDYGNVFIGNDVVCVDEATKVFSHLLSKTVGNESRELLVETIYESLRTAKTAVFLDADANDTLVKHLIRISPSRKILLVQSDEITPKQPVHMSTAEEAYGMALSLAKKGKHLLVPCDSLKTAKLIKRKLENKHKKVLLLSSETKELLDVRRFLRNPNEESKKYDVVLYTSSCDSALSLTTKHFDEVVGIFQGVVDPLEIIQMMGRLRTAKKWLLGCTVLKPIERAQSKLEILEDTKAFFGKSKLSNLDILEGTESEQKNRLVVDFKNSLIAILEQKGHLVIVTESDESYEKRIRKELKEGKKIIRDEEVKAILNAPRLSPTEIRMLEQKFAKTFDERMTLLRDKIAKTLGQKDISEDDVRFHLDNKNAIKLLDIALGADIKSLRDFDKKELELCDSITLYSKFSYIRAMYEHLWECLGFRPNEAESLYGFAECQAFLDKILQASQAEISMWNQLKIGPQIDPINPPKDATKFVNAVLKRMGFVIKSKAVGDRRLYRYYLEATAVRRLLSILATRERAGISVADWKKKPTFSEEKAELRLRLLDGWKERFSVALAA